MRAGSGDARGAVAVCALALLARGVQLFAVAQTPFFFGPVVDAQAYARDAQVVFEHGAIELGFYRPPLYAFLRAGLLGLGLHSPWSLGVLQAIAGACTAVLIMLIARALLAHAEAALQRSAGRAAGVIAALYGPFVIYDIEQLPAAWVNLLIALAVWLAVRAGDELAAEDALGGLCLGVAATGWPPALLLALPVLALRLQRAAAPARVAVAAVFALALSLAPAASAAHNARHGAAGVVISGNLGINLWLGNNPRWRQTIQARPGIYYDLEYQRATRAGAVTLPERERHYLEHVGAEISARPLQALQRTAEKLYLVAHGRELRRTEDLTWLREVSPIARLLTWEHGIMFPFGVLLPLALFCPARALRPRTKWIMLLGALGYALALALFLPAARYRLPVVVLLIPLAAIAVVAWRKSPGAPRLTHTLALLASVVLLNAGNAYGASFAATPAERLRLLAESHAQRGERDRALELSRLAAQRFPDDPDAQLDHGRHLLAAGEAHEAAACFSKAAELVPDSEGPHVLHGYAMLALGDPAAALRDARTALARNPHHPEARELLVRLGRAAR